MSLTQNDFHLTSHQIWMINQYFSEIGKIQFQLGEGPPSSIRVVFEWVPPLGRFVTAYFDGTVEGLTIEDNSK